MVILDEAHHIRNPKTYSAKAVFKFTKVKYRLALTGTPAYGEQKDIFSILHFLYPDQFKTIYKFQDEYMVPEQYVIYVAGQRRCFTEYHKFYPQASKRLTSFLKTISTNRKRSDVMQWLPEKDRQTIRLPATEKQKEALTSLRDNFTFGDINTVGVLDRLVRYRQVCLFPESLGIKEEGPKVSWILDHIKENPGTPIIVFSLFSSFLRYLSVLLRQNNQKFASILGEVPPKVRKTFTDDFQSGKFDIFLINIMAGKEGLTLDRAEEIIFADLYPPIGNIEQAEDRFVATSKDKADKPHTIYNLVIADTFDEDMLKLLQQRKTETDIINCFKKGESK